MLGHIVKGIKVMDGIKVVNQLTQMERLFWVIQVGPVDAREEVSRMQCAKGLTCCCGL